MSEHFIAQPCGTGMLTDCVGLFWQGWLSLIGVAGFNVNPGVSDFSGAGLELAWLTGTRVNVGADLLFVLGRRGGGLARR